MYFKTVDRQEFRRFAPWELFRVSSMQRSDVSLTAQAEAVAEFAQPSPTRKVGWDMSGKLDALFLCRQQFSKSHEAVWVVACSLLVLGSSAAGCATSVIYGSRV